jgi:adenosylmethionine-8-amino-7-oxononanoate aminotransferase
VGLFSALELVYDRDTREALFPLTGPSGPAAGELKAFLTGRGLLANLRGSYLFANPPLIVTTEQLDWALEVLDEGLAIVDAATSSAGAPPPAHQSRAVAARPWAAR